MPTETTPLAVVIGGGPAGLMAAEELGRAGARVIVADARPSLGRKFLMAGKSGLNLTRETPEGQFLAAYTEAAPWLAPMIEAFGPAEVAKWAQNLGQELFTGTTGRVFPKAMKASPLLRAWMGRLDTLGVVRRPRWRWTGWQGDALSFETPQGAQDLNADITILALGGASWARLGSDGVWAETLAARGVDLAPFAAANAGILVNWSDHVAPLFGQPIKGVAFHAGALTSRGEAVLSARGLEGGGIYSVSRAVREGAALSVDLLPDLTVAQVESRLSRSRGRNSLSSHLRKSLKLGPVRTGLLREFAHPLPDDPAALAALIKGLPITHTGLRAMDEAISTAGGVRRGAVDDGLMLRAAPGVFCAGEMLDWEAPTGGYLLTACLATGCWAGRAAARYAGLSPPDPSATNPPTGKNHS